MLSEIPSIRALDALRSHHRRSGIPDPPDAGTLHEIFQNSTINALLEGVYDGSMTYGELSQHGDFGLGTFNALDGEMVALDGEFYQVRSDGIVRPVADSQQTPFATVLFFRPTFRRSLSGPLDYEELQTHLDSFTDGPNLFYAVRMDGRFSFVKTRSVPRQEKPYPPLADVAKNQPVFQFRDVSGTLVGFRFPDFARGLNVPGFHLHFLTEDRTAGGHVLDLVLEHGELSIDASARFHLELPTDPAFLHADLGRDQGQALEQAERGT
ncbi:MAG: acetolactate decarboxylase [Isosphaeraceae bacterium]